MGKKSAESKRKKWEKTKLKKREKLAQKQRELEAEFDKLFGELTIENLCFFPFAKKNPMNNYQEKVKVSEVCNNKIERKLK